MTVGVNTNYYNQYPQYQQNQQQVAGQPYWLNTIGFTANPQTQVQPARDNVADGKDDGHIGFWRATGHVLKGMGKFFTGMFTDKNGDFSIWQTIKTVGTVAAVGALCIATAGTAVPAILAATGIAASSVGLGKSLVQAYFTAGTDAEVEAAFESVGSNAVALGLSVAGAKAVAKSAHAAEAAAGKFNGAEGTWNAVKTTFKDASAPVKGTFDGVGTAFKNGSSTLNKVGNAKDALVQNVKDGVGKNSEFRATVKGNVEKVLNTKAAISEEASAIDKQKANLEKQKANAKTDKSKAAIEKQISELEVKQQAMNEMNKVTTWEEGQNQVKVTEKALETKKAALSKATKDNKAQLQKEVDALQTKLDAQKEVLSRRTSEAQALRSKIDSKTKAYEAIEDKTSADAQNLKAEIDALKAKEGFLPEDVSNQVKTMETVAKNLKNSKPAKTATEQEKLVHQRRTNVVNKKLEELRTQNEAAIGGGNKTHIYNEFKRQIQKDMTDLNNTTPWLTVGIAGRQFGSTPEARFYSQLTAEQRQYFNSLPTAQREQLLNEFKAA